MQEKNQNYQKIRYSIPAAQIHDQFQQLIIQRQQIKHPKNYKDPNFVHNESSLVNNKYHKNSYKGEFKKFDVCWLRATQIFPNYDFDVFRGITATDIKQGHIDNCYLMSALACLAEQPQLISRLFDIEQANLYGIYSVWLNIDGLWRQITLDDYFPCLGDSEEFLCSSNNDNELWVLLLEKAYAKIHGCYWAISLGDPLQALRDLTAAPFSLIEFDDQKQNCWKPIFEAFQKNYILVGGTRKIDPQSFEIIGLQSQHAYSILDLREVIDGFGQAQKILKIRNPYGNFEWQGDFSDESPLWTAQLKQELEVEVKDDGIFWIKLEDFLKYFDYIGILEINPKANFFSQQILQRDDSGKTLIRLEVCQSGYIVFSIDQLSERMAQDENYAYSYFRIVLFQVDGQSFNFIEQVFSAKPNIFLKADLEQGYYFVLIEAYWKVDIARKFTFGYYSESNVKFQQEKISLEVFEKLIYYAWKNYINNQNIEIKESQRIQIPSESGNKEIELDELDLGSVQIYIFKNFENNENCFLKLEYEKSNKDLLCLAYNNQEIEMLLNANDFEIIICSDNPLEGLNTFFEFDIQERRFVEEINFFDESQILFLLQNMQDLHEQQFQKTNHQFQFDLQRLKEEFKREQNKAKENSKQKNYKKYQKQLSSTGKPKNQQQISNYHSEDVHPQTQLINRKIESNFQSDTPNSKVDPQNLYHINPQQFQSSQDKVKISNFQQRSFLNKKYGNQDLNNNQQIFGSAVFQKPNYDHHQKLPSYQKSSFKKHYQHKSTNDPYIKNPLILTKTKFTNTPFLYKLKNDRNNHLKKQSVQHSKNQIVQNSQNYFDLGTSNFEQNLPSYKDQNIFQNQYGKNADQNLNNQSFNSVKSFEFSRLSSDQSKKRKQLIPFCVKQKDLKRFLTQQGKNLKKPNIYFPNKNQKTNVYDFYQLIYFNQIFQCSQTLINLKI